VAAATIAAHGSAEQQSALAGLAAGTEVTTWAMADPLGTWTAGAGLVADPAGDGFELNGAKSYVADVDLADRLLCCASGPAGTTQLLVELGSEGVRVLPLEGIDITRRLFEVSFDRVRVPASAVVGEVGAAGPQVAAALDLGAILAACESLGAMERMLGFTVEYAGFRTAFGRPIGAFQAIKHLLADLSLLLEMSRAAARSATLASWPGGAAAEAAAIAKVFVGESGIEVSQGCLQVHAGIGYTWEHDLHLYLRRLAADSALHGGADHHLARLCELHGV
jgi:alkylation response protein AidB-like acyl-CoA dehydrogenase